MEKILSKENLKTQHMTEAFRPGTEDRVMKLLESYISKRVAFEIDFDMPAGVVTSEGRFKVYHGFVDSTQIVSIKMLLTDATYVHSIDIHEHGSFTRVANTIYFARDTNAIGVAKGLLSVILDLAESNFTDLDEGVEKFANKLDEKRGRTNKSRAPIQDWFSAYTDDTLMDEEEYQARIVMLKKGSWAKLYEQYRLYMENESELEFIPMSTVTFSNYVKEFMEAEGIENERKQGRKPGRKTQTPASVNVDTQPGDDVEEMASNIEDIGFGGDHEDVFAVDENSEQFSQWEQSNTVVMAYRRVWKKFENYVRTIGWSAKEQDAKGQRGLIVRGKGGIGKSHDIPEWLDDVGVDYVTTKQTDMTMRQMIRFFWENRDREVLILDDAGNSAFRKSTAEMMKGAFTERSAKDSPEVVYDAKIKANRPLVDDGIPEAFPFEKPNILIITNDMKSKLDSALAGSRFFDLHVELTPQQVVARIMENINPSEYGATTQQVKDVAKLMVWAAKQHKRGLNKDAYNWRAFSSMLKARKRLPDWKLTVKDMLGVLPKDTGE